MDIRFVSSLTSEDEERLASAIVALVGTVMEQLSIAYTLRIETSAAMVYQRTSPAMSSSTPMSAPPLHLVQPEYPRR